VAKGKRGRPVPLTLTSRRPKGQETDPENGSDAGILLADGLEQAFVGIGRRCGQPDVAVYAIGKAVEVLCRRDGMSAIEAIEFLEFNTIGAWVGATTPMWVEVMDIDDAKAYLEKA
jgi:hypothetical protein